MKVIDLPLIKIVERFAQWFQRMTGIPPIKIALVGEMIFGVSVMSVWMIPGTSLSNKIFSTAVFFIVVVSTIFLYPYLEKVIARDIANKLSNRYKSMPSYICLRMLTTVWVAQDIFRFSHSSTLSTFSLLMTDVGYWIILYFLCCDPLPPGESKIKKFLASFKSFQKRIA